MKKSIPMILIVFTIFIGTIYSYRNLSRKNIQLVSPIIDSGFGINFSPTTIPTQILSESGKYNLLLLGQGDPSHEGSRLTDSIMVIHMDTRKSNTSLIFIPRDIWIKLPQNSSDKTMDKFNTIYSLGLKNGDSSLGLKYAEHAAQTVTGLPIDKAILIDFNNFIQVIDILGGVEVNVTKALDDYYYPVAGKELDVCGKSPEDVTALSATMSGFFLEKQFTCRYEHVHFKVGNNQMDGKTALKFARSRHSNQDGTDFARGLRQQAILLGIKNKLISLDVLKNVDKFFTTFADMVKTDLDIATTKSVASLIINPEDYQINQIIFSDQNYLVSSKNSLGQFILIPRIGADNWTEVHDYIRGQISNLTD